MSAQTAAKQRTRKHVQLSAEAVPSIPKYAFTRNGSDASSEVFVSWGDMERRRCAPGSVIYQAVAKATVDISRAPERGEFRGGAWIEVSFSGYIAGERKEWVALPTSEAFTLQGLRLEDLEPLAALFSALHEQLRSDGLIAGDDLAKDAVVSSAGNSDKPSGRGLTRASAAKA